MTDDVLRKFRELRQKGWMFGAALGAAKTSVKAAPYIQRGLIRIRLEPEHESYWDVYGEEGMTKKDIRLTNQLIEREGLWWACSEARASKKDPWVQADSIGMLIGQDPDLDGYAFGLLEAALEKLDGLFQEDADEMSQMATYAAGDAE